MAITVALSQVSAAVLANQPATFSITITNSSSSAVTISSMQVTEATESDAVIEQPRFVAPNQPVGVGNVVVGASASYTVTFGVVFTGPVMAGPSPQAPGGAAPVNAASTPDANFLLSAAAMVSDGSSAAATLSVSVVAPDSYFPPPQGGSLVLQQGANAVNFLTTLA